MSKSILTKSQRQVHNKLYILRNGAVLRDRQRQARRVIKDTINKIKETTPCTDCGQFFPACAMDFDHLRDKIAEINQLVSSNYPIKSILLEIDKCELVCANCHRVRTRNRR